MSRWLAGEDRSDEFSLNLFFLIIIISRLFLRR